MTRETDFMCRCGDEQRKEADAVYKWALEYLDCSPEELVTYAVYTLNDEHSAQITGIVADQWAAVLANKNNGSFETFVQCDRVEDGVARTLQLFVQHDDKNRE